MVQIWSIAAKPSTTKAFSRETRNVRRASGKLARMQFTAGNVKTTSPMLFQRMIRISFMSPTTSHGVHGLSYQRCTRMAWGQPVEEWELEIQDFIERGPAHVRSPPD